MLNYRIGGIFGIELLLLDGVKNQMDKPLIKWAKPGIRNGILVLN